MRTLLTLTLLVLSLALAPPAVGIPIDVDGTSAEDCVDLDREIAGGLPQAILCPMVNRSELDSPHREFAPAFKAIRAGTYSPSFAAPYLNAARSTLGEARTQELFDLYFSGQNLVGSVSSANPISTWSLYTAYTACAQGHADVTVAANCQAEADSLVSGLLEEAVPELLQARIDHDHPADVANPAYLVDDLRDTVPSSAIGVAGSVRALDVSTLPPTSAPDPSIGNGAVPFLTGPDARANTFDDLPYSSAPGLVFGADGDVYGSWDFTDFSTGLPTFTNLGQTTDAVTGELLIDSRNGQPLVLYGQYDDDVVLNRGCLELGGTMNLATGVCEATPIGDVGDRTTLLQRGCGGSLTARFHVGGVNADGHCVKLNVDGTVGGRGVHVRVLEALSRATLRPPGSELERTDLTDLVAAAEGVLLPGRPANPRGGLFFANGASTGRRVDPSTGAPVRRSGLLECLYRSADGSGTADAALSIGPDGVAATGDETLSTVGNCLLWDNPSAPAAQQTLRLSADIAADHFADQTLFHTDCTESFDEDAGVCGLDALSQPSYFQLIGLALSGGNSSSLSLLGLTSTRLEGFRISNGISNQIVSNRVLGEVLPGVSGSVGTSLPFTPAQGALLGCGPAFASACGGFDVTHTFSEDSTRVALGSNDTPGGPDFMNADWDVLTQDYTVRRAASTDALVGVRQGPSGSYYESGISLAGLTQAQLRGAEALPGGGLLPPSLQAAATAESVATLQGAERALLVDSLQSASGSVGQGSDGWIEPAPWALDPFWEERGVVVYQVADQTQRDPRCDPEAEGRTENDSGTPVYTPDEVAYCTFRRPLWTPEVASSPQLLINNDPTDPTHPDNVWIAGYPDIADDCTAFVDTGLPLGEDQSFLDQFSGQIVNNGSAEAVDRDRGCTSLERFSANWERFQIAHEIMGSDRDADPFETIEEYENWADGDPSNDLTGDPIAGPDGIFTRNASVFRTDMYDVQVVSQGTSSTVFEIQDIAPGFDPAVDDESDFFAGLNTRDDCPAERVFLKTGAGRTSHQTGAERNHHSALPICMTALSATSGFPLKFSPLWLANVDAPACPREGSPLYDPTAPECTRIREGQLALARLLAGESVMVNTLSTGFIGEDHIVLIRLTVAERVALLQNSSTANLDFDALSTRDLDRNQDGAWDGGDDFTPGPIALGNPQCGSGFRGDILQNALQLELYSEAEEAAFAAKFPDGLPPRSPVFCASLSADLGVMGDSPPGRRDAVWQIPRDIGPDGDGDGIPDEFDPCPSFANSDLSDPNDDGIPTECTCADLTGDGVLDMDDLLHMAGCANSNLPAEDCPVASADVWGPGGVPDGKITAIDLGILALRINGTLTPDEVPCGLRP